MVLLNATPIRSEDGEVESVVVTLQDLAPLEEMERLRAEFLGMVSHELRMPLTSIRGSATTLLDAASDLDSAEMRQFHRIIVDQADNMRALIGDLLDVARIETGTLPVDPEPVDVATLVDRARSVFRSAGGRDSLDINLEPYLPPVIFGYQLHSGIGSWSKSFSAMAFKPAGMHPVKLLLRRNSPSRLGRLPSSDGISPVSRLSPRFSQNSSERLPSSGGIVPLSWFSHR